MKRFLVLALALSLSLSSFARGGFLVKAGYSNSNMDLNRDISTVISEDVFSDASFRNLSGYHVGVGYRTGSFSGLRFQPELVYNLRGTHIDDTTAWKMGYLEMPLNLQWGLDLILLRPYVQVSPCIGYNLVNNISDTDAGRALDEITAAANKLEYGLGVGGGLDIMNLIQISVNYNWNFGSVANLEAYQERVSDIKQSKPSCLQVSLAFLF